MMTATYSSFMGSYPGYKDEQLVEKCRSGDVISLAHPQFDLLGFIFPDPKNPGALDSICKVVIYGENPASCTLETLLDTLRTLRKRGFRSVLSKEGAHRLNFNFK